MPRLFLLLVKQMSIVSSTAKQMSMSNVKFYYLSNSILDFGNLVRPGRSATQLIKNRNFTHITLGGPIEQKNFDRRKRQKNGCILRLKITLFDFFSSSQEIVECKVFEIALCSYHFAAIICLLQGSLDSESSIHAKLLTQMLRQINVYC